MEKQARHCLSSESMDFVMDGKEEMNGWSWGNSLLLKFPN